MIEGDRAGLGRFRDNTPRSLRVMHGFILGSTVIRILLTELA